MAPSIVTALPWNSVLQKVPIDLETCRCYSLVARLPYFIFHLDHVIMRPAKPIPFTSSLVAELTRSWHILNASGRSASAREDLVSQLVLCFSAIASELGYMNHLTLVVVPSQ
jgi:hypothetical protein